MSRMRIASCALVMSLVLSSPTALGQESQKVQVFILAGQSNMEGHGNVRTLPRLGEEPEYAPLLAKIRKPDGSYFVRQDVFVTFRAGSVAGPLSVGFGADREAVGPELMFGTIMGEAIKEPVLLIKTAWGGKDLHFDFRPPSAGKLPYPISAKALADRGGEAMMGDCFRKMVAEVHAALKDPGKVSPLLKGKSCRIAGFVWFQGWNEMFPSEGVPFDQVMNDYPGLYAAMIRDLEKEFGLKRLPSVVGEMGVNGEKAGDRIPALRKAQAAIADVPELKGKVRFVRTAPLWDPKLDELQAKERAIRQAQSKPIRERLKKELEAKKSGKPAKDQEKALNDAVEAAIRRTSEYQAWQTEWDKVASHWECHYWGSARTYSLIGNALAVAMKEMLELK